MNLREPEKEKINYGLYCLFIRTLSWGWRYRRKVIESIICKKFILRRAGTSSGYFTHENVFLLLKVKFDLKVALECWRNIWPGVCLIWCSAHVWKSHISALRTESWERKLEDRVSQRDEACVRMWPAQTCSSWSARLSEVVRDPLCFLLAADVLARQVAGGGFKVRLMASGCVCVFEIYGRTSSPERWSDGLMSREMQSDEWLSETEGKSQWRMIREAETGRPLSIWLPLYLFTGEHESSFIVCASAQTGERRRENKCVVWVKWWAELSCVNKLVSAVKCSQWICFKASALLDKKRQIEREKGRMTRK